VKENSKQKVNILVLTAECTLNMLPVKNGLFQFQFPALVIKKYSLEVQPMKFFEG